MFDFLSSDWFVITLEVVLLAFIIYDLRLYLQTGKKDYLFNILITLVFFVWAAIPFYNKYMAWDESAKKALHAKCESENNTTLCSCLEDRVLKEYTAQSYEVRDPKEYGEFLKEAKEECLDDSWF